MMIEAQRSKHSRHYVRKDVFPIDDVFEAMMTKGYYKGVGLHSKRYRVFLLSGTKCAICGIEAQYFAQEKFKEHNKFHMNLYAVRNDREVLMTRDHIIPRSKGGSDNLDNQQTMCFYCNTRKGDKVE